MSRPHTPSRQDRGDTLKTHTDVHVAVLFDSIQQILYSWLARDSSTTVSTDALTPTPSQYLDACAN